MRSRACSTGVKAGVVRLAGEGEFSRYYLEYTGHWNNNQAMSAQIGTHPNASAYPTTSIIRNSTRFVRGVLNSSPNKQPETNSQDAVPPDIHPNHSKKGNANASQVTRSPGKRAVEKSEKKPNQSESYRMQAEKREAVPKVESKAMGVIGSIFMNSTTKYMKTPSIASAARSSPASRDQEVSPSKKDPKINISRPNTQINKVQVKALQPKTTPALSLSPVKGINSNPKPIQNKSREDRTFTPLRSTISIENKLQRHNPQTNGIRNIEKDSLQKSSSNGSQIKRLSRRRERNRELKFSERSLRQKVGSNDKQMPESANNRFNIGPNIASANLLQAKAQKIARNSQAANANIQSNQALPPTQEKPSNQPLVTAKPILTKYATQPELRRFGTLAREPQNVEEKSTSPRKNNALRQKQHEERSMSPVKRHTAVAKQDISELKAVQLNSHKPIPILRSSNNLLDRKFAQQQQEVKPEAVVEKPTPKTVPIKAKVERTITEPAPQPAKAQQVKQEPAFDRLWNRNTAPKLMKPIEKSKPVEEVQPQTAAAAKQQAIEQTSPALSMISEPGRLGLMSRRTSISNDLKQNQQNDLEPEVVTPKKADTARPEKLSIKSPAGGKKQVTRTPIIEQAQHSMHEKSMRVPNLKHSNMLLQIAHRYFMNKLAEAFNRLLIVSRADSYKRSTTNALLLAIQNVVVRQQVGLTRNLYQIIKNGYMKALKERKELPMREFGKQNAFLAVMERVAAAKKRDCFVLIKWEAQANRYSNISVKQKVDESPPSAVTSYLVQQLCRIVRSYNNQQKLRPSFNKIVLQSVAFKPKAVMASKVSSKITTPLRMSHMTRDFKSQRSSLNSLISKQEREVAQLERKRADSRRKIQNQKGEVLRKLDEVAQANQLLKFEVQAHRKRQEELKYVEEKLGPCLPVDNQIEVDPPISDLMTRLYSQIYKKQSASINLSDLLNRHQLRLQQSKIVNEWIALKDNVELKRQISLFEGESKNKHEKRLSLISQQQLVCQTMRGSLRERYLWICFNETVQQI